MGQVLAWIVAVEKHTAAAGCNESGLDFPDAIAIRALEWAEWLARERGARLLLNIAVGQGTEQRQRLEVLAPMALNPADAHLATTVALRRSLSQVSQAHIDDTLLLLWIGHGVVQDGNRMVLLEDSRALETAYCWHVGSLLKSLRTGTGPGLQIGVFDTCAQVVEHVGFEILPGAGGAQCRQHFYFAATSGAFASLSTAEETMTSIVLDGLKAVPFPLDPLQLFAQVHPRAARLPSLAVPFEWTSGSGDLWSSAGLGRNPDVGIRETARSSGCSEIFFRHLWEAVRGADCSPGALAKALKANTVDKLIAHLAEKDGDASRALGAALGRVRRVEGWVTPLAALRLRMDQWTELARLVAAEDAREVAQFAELRDLLLWVIDMGSAAAGFGARGEQALLRLMVLAAKEAARSVTGSNTAVQGLRTRLKDDSGFAGLLAAVDAAAQLPAGQPTLMVELTLSPLDRDPTLGRSWIARHNLVEPGPEMPGEGPAGTQLKELIHRARSHPGQELRVEILASAELLCGRREWVSYPLDVGADVADWVEIDALVPVCWRWRERMMDEPNYARATWELRARDARNRISQRVSLHCAFDDEEPPLDDPDLLGLVERPPGPTEPLGRLSKFKKKLVQGHPYMLWPAADTVNVLELKVRVKKWLAKQKFTDLPEGYCRERSAGRLPHLVLFLDEPDRNPYAQTTGLRTMSAVPVIR